MKRGDAGTALPDVVVTPLARTMLRPFAAVVMPGADHRSLGAMPVDDSLLPRSAAAALSLPTSADRRDARAARLRPGAAPAARDDLAAARRRRRSGRGEPVRRAPALRAGRGAHGRRRAGRPARLARSARRAPPRGRAGAADRADGARRRLAGAALRQRVRGPARLPVSLLRRARPASVGARRARRRGREARLRHLAARGARTSSIASAASRATPPPTRRACARSASSVRAAMGIDAAAFLPYDASFAGFVPRYVEWLHDRERRGWRWQSGESERAPRAARARGRSSCTAASIASTDVDGKDGPTLELIDYKTGSVETLKETAARAARGHAARVLRRARRRRALPVARELPRRRSHAGPDPGRASPRRRRRAHASSPASPTRCGACAPAPACARSAKAAPASTARRAACAGATTGPSDDDGAVTRPALRVDGRRVDAASAFYAAACDPARSVRRRGLRRLGQDLDAGLAHAARAARRRGAARDPRDHLHARRRRRDARAPRRMARRVRDAALEPRRSACSALRRARRRSRRGPRRSRPSSARCRAACSRPDGRSRSAPSTAGSRSCCASAPLALLDRLGVQADAELVEDWREHRPAVHPRLPRRGAARRRPCAPTTPRPRRRAAGTSCASGSTRSGTGASSSSSPTRPACSRPASSAPRTSGPSSRPTRIPPSRSRPRRGRDAAARRGARAGRGARQAGARRGRRARRGALRCAPRRALRRRVVGALHGDRGQAAQARRGAAARRAGAGRARSICGDQVHQHESREEHLRMVRLGRALLAALADYKRSAGLADMADLERCRARPAARRRARRAGSRSGSTRASRHLLIDEFQDTSPLQWHALHGWLSGYAGAGGGASGQRPPGVFIVGDPKQSIYRFRRAEPRVFEAARDVRARGARRQRPGLRPHAPQRAAR